MRLRIERSERAEADLDDIWTYIAERNEPAADRLLLRILEVLEELADNPDMGPARVMRFSRDISADKFRQ